MSHNELLVPPTDSDPANIYRLHSGCVQFSIARSISTSWRTLSHEDVLQHIVLHTVVAEWLLERLQKRIAVSKIPTTEWLKQRIELWN
jgi:hypothetical protein